MLGQCLKIRPRPLLANPSQFIIHLSSFHSTLYSLSNWKKAYLNKLQINKLQINKIFYRYSTDSLYEEELYRRKLVYNVHISAVYRPININIYGIYSPLLNSSKVPLITRISKLLCLLDTATWKFVPLYRLNINKLWDLCEIAPLWVFNKSVSLAGSGPVYVRAAYAHKIPVASNSAYNCDFVPKYALGPKYTVQF
jgi:hypothetical protein